MRGSLLLCVVVAAGLFAVQPACAADVSGIAPSALRALGLEQIQVVSDARGDAVRGKGVIIVGTQAGAGLAGRSGAFSLFYASKTPSVIDVGATAPPVPGGVNVNVQVRVNFPNLPSRRR